MYALHTLHNDVHRAVTFADSTSFAMWSALCMVVTVNGVATTRWQVECTLYGPDWTEGDIERAARNSRFLDATGTKDQALRVRDHLATTCRTWLNPKR